MESLGQRSHAFLHEGVQTVQRPRVPRQAPLTVTGAEWVDPYPDPE
jgi:hypothetical protein